MQTRELTDELCGSKETPDAVQAVEEPYRVLFERNPQPMWVYDVDSLTFLAVNPAAVELSGYSRDEFLRISISDIRPPQDRVAAPTE